MRDVLPTLLEWADAGYRFALATVTHTWGSSPRPLGSVMGVREDGVTCGSVSGGCVETTVIQAAATALGDGQWQELVFGALSADELWEVGLSCGGKIQVWLDPDPVNRNPAQWDRLVRALQSNEPCLLATRLSPCQSWLWPGADALPEWVAIEAEIAMKKGRSAEVERDGERFFLQAFTPREQLLIVGAVHIAVPLVQFARTLGFETIVIDPRAQFATAERFPVPPDRFVVEWPESALAGLEITSATSVVVLTHDPKIDDVALAMLLRSPARYLGALGSRTTQRRRRETLAADGFSEDEIQRIHGPIGLAIGAKTPEEIALSILAEIVQVRHAGS
ncbi:MAG: XdhC family protein [Fimbriimonadaceae bacterium]|nr:XdhC family protein [Fimbriimonadaceae bacterium]